MARHLAFFCIHSQVQEDSCLFKSSLGYIVSSSHPGLHSKTLSPKMLNLNKTEDNVTFASSSLYMACLTTYFAQADTYSCHS